MQSGLRRGSRSWASSVVLNMITDTHLVIPDDEKPRSNSGRAGITPRYPLQQGEMPVSDPKIVPSLKPRRSLSRTVALAIVVIAVSAAAIFEARRAHQIWSASERLPAQLPKPPQLPAGEPPDPIHLNTIPIRSADERHLLDGDFNIVVRMSDLTESCRDIFDSSFFRFSGSAASKEQVKFADPGQDFEATDDLRGGLPFRRLEFAGLSSKTCFVYYEVGGRMGPATCLAIMDYTQGKAIWVGELFGESTRKVANINQLRNKLSTNQFTDRAGPGC